MIRTAPAPHCHVCDAPGRSLHRGLVDWRCGAPGTWNVSACPEASCGLLWQDPMAIEVDLPNAYPASSFTHEPPPAAHPWLERLRRPAVRGYLAARYGYRFEVSWITRQRGRLLSLQPLTRLEIDASVMGLPAIPGGRCLDLGCGPGATMRVLAALGWRMEGIDRDPTAVAHAQAAGLAVRQGGLEEQAYAEKQFDAITLSHVIELVPDPARLLEAAARILKPRGYLAILTPNARSVGHRRFGDAWFALDPPRHLHIFTRTALTRLVEDSGFAIIWARTTPRGAPETFAASRAIRRTGRYAASPRPPARVRAWARAMMLAEWARLPLDPDAGEELAVLARTPAASG